MAKTKKTSIRKITKADKAEYTRMDKEIQAVIEVIKYDYPTCTDYSAIDKTDKNGEDLFEILDAKDKRIAIITGSQITRYWNIMEGF